MREFLFLWYSYFVIVNRTFFRFLLGFVGMLGISFFILFSAGFYETEVLGIVPSGTPANASTPSDFSAEVR